MHTFPNHFPGQFFPAHLPFCLCKHRKHTLNRGIFLFFPNTHCLNFLPKLVLFIVHWTQFNGRVLSFKSDLAVKRCNRFEILLLPHMKLQDKFRQVNRYKLIQNLETQTSYCISSSSRRHGYECLFSRWRTSWIILQADEGLPAHALRKANRWMNNKHQSFRALPVRVVGLWPEIPPEWRADILEDT